ncbi:hypothetical protein N825_21765 [Skermanella stibiiresistens SB22]|uniref:Integrase catalytic domain-containing protein n=1 Tax=Skermanella stibiiresistens SB22 TaxID=1385369 RepID=W9GWQ8_9PROT|nr:hypothetical protein N825_21765 [Skermanella stibiiresistens SB22]
MHFEIRRQAKDEVIDWLTFHSRNRMHSTLGYTSPMVFEENWRRQQQKGGGITQALWEALHGGKVKQTPSPTLCHAPLCDNVTDNFRITLPEGVRVLR